MSSIHRRHALPNVSTVNLWYLLVLSGCLHRSYVAAPPQVEPLALTEPPADCQERFAKADHARPGEPEAGPVRLIPRNGGPLNVATVVYCEAGKVWQAELGWAQRVVPVDERRYLVTTGDPHVRRTGFYLVEVDDDHAALSTFLGPPVPFVASPTRASEPGVALTHRALGGYTRWCVSSQRVEACGRAR